jgi:trans-aconitate methyltransferase
VTEGTSSTGRNGAPGWDDDHPAFDRSIAHQARIYNYLLGGKDNFPADRLAAEKAIDAYPGTVYLARANRALLGRAVHYLAAEAGVRQFLDIGTGIPSAGSTHEVAQRVAPASRVVYVDHDPVVLAHARTLLTSSPEGATDYIEADLRGPAAILEKAARTLDFTQPVALLLLLILHAIGDEDEPHRIVAALVDALPSGSYLAITHGANDVDPDMAEVQSTLNQSSYQQYTFRSQAETRRFFDGLEFVEPGLVQVDQWRPDIPPAHSTPMPAGLAPMPVGLTPIWSGVARKP